MDTPLMDEIERRVFFRSPPAHQQSFHSGLPTISRPQAHGHPSYHPPATRNGRLRMLTSFLSTGSSSSSSSHPTARSGEVDPETADASLPRSLRHVQSFETSAYSVIGIPTSPNADEELNGLGRTGVMDGSDAAACRLFKPLPPPQPQHPYQHSTPRKILSKIFGIGNGGNGSVRGKSKRMSLRRDADVDDADYPLDGEEGELIDDEACFVDAKEISGFGKLACGVGGTRADRRRGSALP